MLTNFVASSPLPTFICKRRSYNYNFDLPIWLCHILLQFVISLTILLCTLWLSLYTNITNLLKKTRKMLVNCHILCYNTDIMKVKRLKISNFRNYASQLVEFKSGINFLIGKNAQGKTNLLEAIYISSLGHSPRTNKERDTIKWDTTTAKIALEIERRSGTVKLETHISKNHKKIVTINDIPILRIGELLGQLNVIYFSPDELSLIKDAANQRRRFLDINISQIKKPYFYTLGRYNKILSQRNRLLKQISANKASHDTLAVWDSQLAKEGAQIILTRQKFIQNLTPYICLAHASLTSLKEQIALTYETSIVTKETTSREVNNSPHLETEIENLFLQRLTTTRERDIGLGHTSTGPHRDDIKLSVNDVDVRLFGSQGQQRTATLSLKLGLFKLYENLLKEAPVLLLDDVFSELDEARKQNLLDFCKGQSQTIITGVDTLLNDKAVADILKQTHSNIFYIENGSVKV